MKKTKSKLDLVKLQAQFDKLLDNFTSFYDDNNQPIFVGNKLKSEWGYEVIVVKDEDGNFIGKLVCDNQHSCKNIPYALNKGKGYIKII